jgi:hypothetical protein
MEGFKNKNRGYQQLRVWRDAIEFYKLNCKIFGKFSHESVERKQMTGDWIDHLVVKDSNDSYEESEQNFGATGR